MNEVLADLTGAFYGLLIWPSLNFLFKFWPRHWKKNFQISESTYSNRKLQRSMFWGERKVPVYQASLQYKEPHSSIPAVKILVSKIYMGLSGNKLWERYNHCHWTFSNKKNNPFNPNLAVRNANLQNTTLSNHINLIRGR